MPPQFVTLGMFIIDEFSFLDEDGNPTGKMLSPQIGGAGTYAAVGARIWLDADQVGMVVDRGHDWPSSMQKDLERYGADMWMFRNRPEGKTTRALNSYMGDHRSFDYLTPRIRITPLDLKGTRLAGALRVHLVCSPRRASDIVSEIQDIPDWNPIMIWEPIPDRCIPEELDALVEVLPSIHILSPNADEALTVLSMESPPTKENIEEAAQKFLDYGIGKDGEGAVVIRSGPLGAYVSTTAKGGKWIGAFWTEENPEKVVDVTGAGNSFLGGLGAGLSLVEDDVYDATLYASVSASYTIEQEGLPRISMALDGSPLWNGEKPDERLKVMKERYSS